MSTIKSLDLRFFDKAYNERIGSLDLFIQASKNCFYFAYFDAEHKQFVGLEERPLETDLNWHQLSEQLSELLKADFSKKFRKVTFALIDPTYSLIPTSLFNELEAINYLKLNHQLEDIASLNVKSYEVTAIGTQIVYAIPSLIERALKEHFSTVGLIHYTAPLLESFALDPQKEDELHLNVQKDSFDVLYSKNGKLQLLNTFNYQTAEDFVYYLLYVMEQLSIDRNRIELLVYGEIESTSTLYETLFKYIRHPQLSERTNKVKYSNVLQAIQLHRYKNLFNQYLCA